MKLTVKKDKLLKALRSRLDRLTDGYDAQMKEWKAYKSKPETEAKRSAIATSSRSTTTR